MPKVLVSGMAELVSAVADALRSRGADVTEVVELDKVPAVSADEGQGVFDAYVQLPATFDVRGDTVIRRVHHFYADGVLARFPALAGALPSLTPQARVIFVMGQLPSDVSTDADREARQALVEVLGHAARADAEPDREITVRILDAGSTPDQIALRALGQDPLREGLLSDLEGLSYADWRVELLGMVSMET
jgi:hypothetical protein